MTADKQQTIRVTLVKSMIGRSDKLRRILKSLGLYKMNQVVQHSDTAIIRGMIHKVKHLINVEAA